MMENGPLVLIIGIGIVCTVLSLGMQLGGIIEKRYLANEFSRQCEEYGFVNWRSVGFNVPQPLECKND
jgi:hypothetical protein